MYYFDSTIKIYFNKITTTLKKCGEKNSISFWVKSTKYSQYSTKYSTKYSPVYFEKS